MTRKLNVDLSQGIKKLEIFSKRIVNTKFLGQYRTSVKSKGLEFSSFREYTPADDASLIDWKTTVRLNKPMIKQFVEERNLEIFFLIDVSSSMVFGSTQKLKNEYVAELVCTLAYAILNVGDSVGYALFSDTISNIVQPAVNKNIFYQLSKTLINPDNYGGSYNLELALEKSARLLKKNSILIIVSDFIGLKGNWQDQLKKAAYKLDIIGVMVRDPRDREIPEDSDMVLIADPFTDEQIILDPSPLIREKYRLFSEKQENYIETAFSGSRASFLKLDTNQQFLIPVLNFFKKRQKWSR